MRNFHSLSRIVKISACPIIDGSPCLPSRTANYVATLFTRGFENSQQHGEVLALYLAGEISGDAVEFIHSPSEMEVLTSFRAWLNREIKIFGSCRPAFTYINCNTGFSLTFLDVRGRIEGASS